MFALQTLCRRLDIVLPHVCSNNSFKISCYSFYINLLISAVVVADRLHSH